MTLIYRLEECLLWCISNNRWKLLSCCHSTRPGSDGKSIASFILGMSRMALYPMESHAVAAQQRLEAHP
jgi:hypothetical protein